MTSIERYKMESLFQSIVSVICGIGLAGYFGLYGTGPSSNTTKIPSCMQRCTTQDAGAYSISDVGGCSCIFSVKP